MSSSKQVAQLVRMANQIALNMSAWGSEADVARKTEEHITKFWTPDMRRRLPAPTEQGPARALIGRSGPGQRADHVTA